MNAIGKIAVAKASLPTNYQEAKTALAECVRVDECKSWADKAAALASYAKQADDERLLSYAKRIKVRAIDRMGELIEAVAPKGGQAAKGSGYASRRSPARRNRLPRKSALSPECPTTNYSAMACRSSGSMTSRSQLMPRFLL
jgi:hypothetical protein